MNILHTIKSPKDIKKLNIYELTQLAEEIRQYIVQVVSKNGGHLASNLGVVELTLALHYVFDSPCDKIIFDVGHQCYTHKILTGRKDEFQSLRKNNGISGFPKSDESEHDCFNTGHSSTSISAAIGLCRARDLQADNYSVISIIGDGAISGGLAFEGLNNIAQKQTNMIVVLNDNEMSISKNVGAISDQLSKIRVSKKYLKLKENIKKSLENMPIFGKEIENAVKKTRNVFKNILIKGMIFEHFGLKYLGPIDGHNIRELIKLLSDAKKLNEPVLLHVLTNKGKGLKVAELHPEEYHGYSPIHVDNEKTFSSEFGSSLVNIAKEDDKIVAISAAMTIGTGLTEFEKTYPERYFDVGICEQHAVTMAAGLAKGGYKPFVAIYSTFLQRAYDQILHDVCLQNLPVTFCLDRAGLNCKDGETHHGIYDLAYLSHMPNIQILTPSSYSQLDKCLHYAKNAMCPVAIRYPSGGECVIDNTNQDIFKWQYVVNNNAKTTILAVGNRMTKLALEVALVKSCNVVCVTSIKPLDYALLDKLKKVVTLEDGVLSGGLYTQILQYYNGKNIKIKGFGYSDKVLSHGSFESLLKNNGISVESIVKCID